MWYCWQNSLDFGFFIYFFPTSHLFLHSIYCHSLGHKSYKYPTPGLVERQAIVAPLLSLISSVSVCLTTHSDLSLSTHSNQIQLCIFSHLFPFPLCFHLYITSLCCHSSRDNSLCILAPICSLIYSCFWDAAQVNSFLILKLLHRHPGSTFNISKHLGILQC
jgi:hypothetical protein